MYGKRIVPYQTSSTRVLIVAETRKPKQIANTWKCGEQCVTGWTKIWDRLHKTLLNTRARRETFGGSRQKQLLALITENAQNGK